MRATVSFHSFTMQDSSIIIWDDPPSSPFMTEVSETSRQASRALRDAAVADPEIDAIFDHTQETPTVDKIGMISVSMEGDKENALPEAIIMGQETPLKRPQARQEPATAPRPATGRGQMLPPSTTKTPAFATTGKKQQYTQSKQQEDTTPSRVRLGRTDTGNAPIELPSIDETGIDDTCFSTFSAVPDMTLFSRMGQPPSSPSKASTATAGTDAERTPRPASRKRPSPSRSPSPTPQRARAGTASSNGTIDGNTSLLIDFTQQFDACQASTRSPVRPMGLTPSRTESNLASFMSAQRTPAGRSTHVSPTKSSSNLLNLLDFELPPPPTPRSAPAFSAREVETLKSGFASQVSGLKARLSGKEAEVESLKKALEDAERRVGEAEERERSERARRETAEADKDGWEKRGVEVERLLATVKAEVVNSEAEREALVRRTEEAERRAEELEGRNLDLTTKLAAAGEGNGAALSDDDKDAVQRMVQAQLDAKIEGVSRELHAVYKKKHETKVATLKKSYEARSEKRSAELAAKVEELTRQNEELRLARDETLSGEVMAGGSAMAELHDRRAECERLRAADEASKAATAGLRGELESLRQDHSRLVMELEAERVEKGELVAAVDEMLALQAGDSGPQSAAVVEDLRKSLSRPPPGLRTPASSIAESKMARPSGLAKLSGSNSASKSKMMSNIERMGGTRN